MANKSLKQRIKDLEDLLYDIIDEIIKDNSAEGAYSESTESETSEESVPITGIK